MMPELSFVAEYEVVRGPLCRLDDDGLEALRREIAPRFRDEHEARYPNTKFGTIKIDGMAYAGWVRK